MCAECKFLKEKNNIVHGGKNMIHLYDPIGPSSPDDIFHFFLTRRKWWWWQQ